MKKVIFNVYPTDSLMYFSGILFCAVLVIFVPLYNISNTEMLEQISWIKKIFVVEKDGENYRTKLVIFRWIALGVFSGLAMLTEDVTIVLNLVGGLIIPLVSFYIPVS
jgi:hypothetical protein